MINTREIAPHITQVVVYTDRARVTRSTTLSLEAGKYRLAIPQLPLQMDPASVRASAQGTARARLRGIEVQRTFYEETPVERIHDLETQIESLEDELRDLDAHREWLEHERAALQALAGQSEAYARGLAFGRTAAEGQMALFDQLRSRVEALNGTLSHQVVERRTLQRRLEKLQNELNQLRRSRGRERRTAFIEVEVLQAGDLTVEMICVVSSAQWRPLYDLRLVEPTADTAPRLEVGYLAQIIQQSGEDWSDVSLVLSTARPILAETVPELDPWYIAPLSPQPALEKRRAALGPVGAMPAPAPAAAAALVAEPEEEPVAAEVVMAAVESSGAAVTYRVPETATIHADGTPHKVAIAQFDLLPDLDYVAAPKLAEAAYRRATVTNESAYTLLPGSANLFAGDEFIGHIALELTAPGGEMELYLGADDRIEIERELKRREVERKLLGDRRRIRYAYEITLHNTRSTEVTLTLHDQIPVSRHEEVKVKLESASPAPTEQTELNVLTWELTLPPGEEQIVRFDFSVEHPRGMTVTGLP